MNNIFIVYDTNGNITQATSNYPQVTPPQQMLVCDNTTTNASNALSQPSHYMVQNGQIIPAVTIHIDRQHTMNDVWDTYTLTLTASDGGAHTLNLSIMNHTESITLAADIGATYKVAIHQAVTQSKIDVIVSGQGVVTNDLPIGGSDTSTPLQTYVDSAGLLHVAPTQKTTLIAYYSAKVPQELSVPDLTTADSMLMQTVFGIILPALTGESNPLVSLDANQQNAVADIQANVLPNIVTTLENAAPVPAAGQSQTFDLHYKSYRDDLAIAKKAFDLYVADVQSIPNLA